ncbi:hypothetical protein H5410_004359 [Solanum commersonii]|uniref:Uncharacterized protein n=1 Tax=Solanum commersonii TaxID=4109 RepID=A0A9J6B7T0_SOLCO|nr:hypothetical protein H5410_004359 [Solanum commersonii]
MARKTYLEKHGKDDQGYLKIYLHERTMKLHNIVKKALNPLYLNTVHIQADQWLQDFQRTIDAWQRTRRNKFSFQIGSNSGMDKDAFDSETN